MGAPQEGGGSYLPPLDQCLEGRQLLVSWRAIYTSICDPSSLATRPATERALKDETTRAHLVDPCSSFSPPNPASKSSFDALFSRTSHTSAKDVQADAVWLSKEANVDEVSALRVTLLEWQQRTKSALRSQWYEEEVQNLQNAAAASGKHALSELLSIHSGLASSEPPTTDAEKLSRQKALFLLCLEEQEYLLKTAEVVAGIAQLPDLQPNPLSVGPTASVSQDVQHAATEIWRSQQAKSKGMGPFVEAIRDIVNTASDSQNWPSIASTNDRIASAYSSGLSEKLLTILRMLHVKVMAARTQQPNTADISLWYSLMDETSFLGTSLGDSSPSVQKATQTLISLVSAEVLRLTTTVDYINSKFGASGDSLYPDLQQQSYIENEDCVRLITGCLLGATSHDMDHISPAILTWSIICQSLRQAAQGDPESTSDGTPTLHRSGSFRASGTSKLSKAELLLNCIFETGSAEQDPITEMGSASVNRMHIFDILPAMLEALASCYRLPLEMHTVLGCRMTVFDITRHAAPLISYGAEIVQTLMATLSYESYNLTGPDGQHALSLWPLQPAKSLHEDQEILGPILMSNLVSRYPYELDTFLLCLNAIGRSAAYIDGDGSKIARLLENLTTFTTILPRDFDAYTLVQDDDMSNCIQLTRDFPILIDLYNRQRLTTRSGAEDGLSVAIPAGSIGTVLNESKPLIVSWQYSHSGLEYLGALLSTAGPGASFRDARSPDGISLSTAADIIGLINTMILGTMESSDSDSSEALLARLSSSYSGNDDIIRVIFEILEDQLQLHMAQPGSEASILLLTRIIEFSRLLLSVSPERTWSMLGKSKLLPLDDSPGALSAIVGSTELPAGQYTFLHACTSLFRSLIDDFVARSVSRSGSNKAVTRFGEQASRIGSTPSKLMSSLLFNFSRVVLDVLQSQPSWRFNNPVERHNIVCEAFGSLNELLAFSQDSQAAPATSSRLFAGFEAAAANIASAFLTDNIPDLAVQGLLDVFINALVELSARPDSRDNHEVVAATVQAIRFCSSLLRTGLIKEKSGMALRMHLYKALPLIARLYTAHDAFRPHVAELVTRLVQYSDTTTEEPPSILGFLPAQTAKSFLKAVTEIELPLQNLETEAQVWDMLSAIVSHKQQWLAISLLTGSTPRERLQQKDTSAVDSSKSLITIAMERLAGIASLPPRRAIAVLAFLSHAQQHWAWISTSIIEHSSLVDGLTTWLSELAPNNKPSDVEASIRNANENQMAAFVAEILARLFHNVGSSTKPDKLKAIVPKLKYLRDHATAVDGYNHSLHRNLKKNFEQKYPTCSLNDFKRNSFGTAQLGRDYYYDLELAEKVLGFDPAFRRSNGQGFVDEIARANVNFSVVDSQIALLKSWKGLALAIASSGDSQTQADMATVVAGCLKANIDNTMPAQVFENVSEIRAELAFALLQTLVRNKDAASALKELLPVAWDTIRQSGLDFEVITSAKDAAYYRLLLQILFLTIQTHKAEQGVAQPQPARGSLAKSASTVPTPLNATSNTLLEIITRVIAVNFKAICTLVHSADPSSEEASLVEPSDFVLLTAMLQSILRTSSAALMQRQIATTIANAHLSRYAVSLYSWSDSLTPSDPVYGELSILFLLTLSSLPLVAEQLAVEGVLTTISTANLSQAFRSPSGPKSSGGKGPFDQPPRLHTIWARGILPLVLNILSAVGPGIAGDISSFLNGFAPQIARCEAELAAPSGPRQRGALTLSLAAEVHSLALLAAVIESLRMQGAAVGINPADVPSLAFDRAGTKEVLEELLKARRSLKERIVPVGDREAGLARAKGRHDGESVLEEMVVAELQGALSCLQ